MKSMVMKLVKKFKLGRIAYIVGGGGALLLGLLSGLNVLTVGSSLILGLVIAGVIIGLLNIKSAEALPVMVASLVLGIGAGVLSILPFLGGILESMLTLLATLVIPVALVTAISVLLKKLS